MPFSTKNLGSGGFKLRASCLKSLSLWITCLLSYEHCTLWIGPLPPYLAVARPAAEGGWSVDHCLLHDGRQLSQVSAGARLGARVVLGSPFSRGILVCGL